MEDWNNKPGYIDDDKNIYTYSTYNPNSKWDWYQVGGRWTGYFKLKENTKGVLGKPGLMTEQGEDGFVDQLYKKDIDIEWMKNNNKSIVPFALVNNGKWYKRGEMGWWACVSNEKGKDEWENEFNKLFDSIPDDSLITIVDCHI